MGEIISLDGVWQWDDTNQTDLPKGPGILVEGQEWYSFASEYLKVEEIRILDLNGTPIKIKQIDREDLGELSWEEYFGLESGGAAKKGFPTHYDILGDSIRLGPAPTSTSVTLASGIEVDFKRTVVLFTPVSTTAADTTSPGLPSTYHPLLAYMAAIPYNEIYHKDRVARQQFKANEMRKNLMAFYTKRNPDRRNILTPKYEQHL